MKNEMSMLKTTPKDIDDLREQVKDLKTAHLESKDRVGSEISTMKSAIKAVRDAWPSSLSSVTAETQHSFRKTSPLQTAESLKGPDEIQLKKVRNVEDEVLNLQIPIRDSPLRHNPNLQ